MIDLHSHSSFSDGLLHPAELVKKALACGVRCLALTDHDTLEGLDAFHEAAKNTSLHTVSGIEISTKWKKYDIHILGIKVQATPLLETLVARQVEHRIARAKAIGKALENYGVENAYEKAAQLAGHARVGRPHFAKLLLLEGRIPDMQTGFKWYLGSGKPAYVPSAWCTVSEAVTAITDSGGIAVLAHPLKYGLTRTKLRALIEEFKEAGGLGMEVISGQMTTVQIRDMMELGLKYQLLASSGSDYHGDGVSFISPGKQPLLPAACIPLWHDWVGIE